MAVCRCNKRQNEFLDDEWIGSYNLEQYNILNKQQIDPEILLSENEFTETEMSNESEDELENEFAITNEISSTRNRTYVKWVQHSLNKILGIRLGVDGIYGRNTKQALKYFQTFAGISVDGIVGSQTEKALTEYSTIKKPVAISSSRSHQVDSVRWCPVKSKRATLKCTSPGTKKCPAISKLLCVPHINQIPLEYVSGVGVDRKTGLQVITRRTTRTNFKMTSGVYKGLAGFVIYMKKFGIPVEAILSQGAHLCRCVGRTNRLSQHSYGNAFDFAGVRWALINKPPSRLRETIVHNYWNIEQRGLLRRINACLRLNFSLVLDYNYNSDHFSHFHVEAGSGMNPRSRSTILFVQEALGHILQRDISVNGRMDAYTQQAIIDYSGNDESVISNSTELNSIFKNLFSEIAAG